MDKLILKPEALFLMGKRMDGLYYNYEYYSAIDPVENGGGNKLLWRFESELAEEGLLAENDDGDLVPSPEAAELLRPVYFGAFQSELLYYPNVEEAQHFAFRFHWLDGECRLVTPVESGFQVERLDEVGLRHLLVQLMPEGYLEREAPSMDQKIDFTKLGQCYRAASNYVDGVAREMTVISCDGWLFERGGEEEAKLLSPMAFLEGVMKIIKEDV